MPYTLGTQLWKIVIKNIGRTYFTSRLVICYVTFRFNFHFALQRSYQMIVQLLSYIWQTYNQISSNFFLNILPSFDFVCLSFLHMQVFIKKKEKENQNLKIRYMCTKFKNIIEFGGIKLNQWSSTWAYQLLLAGFVNKCVPTKLNLQNFT